MIHNQEANLDTELNREELTRLTRSAFQLLDAWSIPLELHSLLLGLEPGMSKRFVNRYRLGMHLPVAGDSYARIDLLLGIDNALHKLFPHSQLSANLWMTTRNPRYGGKAPLDTMVQGGLDGIEQVERALNYRDGW